MTMVMQLQRDYESSQAEIHLNRLDAETSARFLRETEVRLELAESEVSRMLVIYLIHIYIYICLYV